jgi:hypothetical protein
MVGACSAASDDAVGATVWQGVCGRGVGSGGMLGGWNGACVG